MVPGNPTLPQNDPRVSIIIPAWNAEKWIGATLQSVVSQTWTKLEVVVVDDASTDATASIVENWPDKRIRLIRQLRAGASAARNRGFANANGDLIQFLDADDLLSDNKLFLQIEALRRAPENSVASCTWQHIADEPDANPAVIEVISAEPDPIEWLTQSLSGSNMMHPAAWLVPRAVAEAAGPWNNALSLHDDGDYFARVLSRATRNVFVREAKVLYRSVPASLSRRRSQAAIESAFAVCKARHDTLLGARDTPGTRVAIATQYAQFAYEFGSSAPDLSRLALNEIRTLKASPANRVGSPVFRKAVALVGFTKALVLRSRIVGG